jgi:hypothetical protein
MYYNDNLSFQSACNYADENNFEYDCYMKYRSDILNDSIPDIILSNEIKIYSIVPMCNFISGGLFSYPIVCDIYAFGNRQSMRIYCNTYDYVLNKNIKYNGKYYIAFECSLTDNIYENNVPITYINLYYSLDRNRRMFDDIENDIRSKIPSQTFLMKITNDISITTIEAIKQE